jgi:hypothetical protein
MVGFEDLDCVLTEMREGRDGDLLLRDMNGTRASPRLLSLHPMT